MDGCELIIDALKVGPDEVLVVRIAAEDSDQAAHLLEALDHVGLKGRALVIVGDDIQMAAVPRDEAPDG